MTNCAPVFGPFASGVGGEGDTEGGGGGDSPYIEGRGFAPPLVVPCRLSLDCYLCGGCFVTAIGCAVKGDKDYILKVFVKRLALVVGCDADCSLLG